MIHKNFGELLHSPYPILRYFFAHPTCKPSFVLRLNVGVTIISLAFDLHRRSSDQPAPVMKTGPTWSYTGQGLAPWSITTPSCGLLPHSFHPCILNFAVSAWFIKRQNLKEAVLFLCYFPAYPIYNRIMVRVTNCPYPRIGDVVLGLSSSIPYGNRGDHPAEWAFLF